MVAVLTEVGERYNVTRLVVVTALIGDPYLDLVDRHTARDIRHALHRFLVVVTEEMAQEEMAVLVVTVTRDVESRHLCTAFTAHRLCLAVLLRNQCLDLQLTELEVRLDTEQGLAAADQG